MIIHAGSVKTGSSYLQSSLALSEDVLQRSGYFYPDHPNSEFARRGLITSGNLSPEMNWVGAIHQDLESLPAGATLLYSNENMVNAFIRQPKHLVSIKNAAELELIILLRDPYDHFCSFYGQLVKRHGFHCEPLEVIPLYQHFHEVAELSTGEKNEHFKINILNYDVERGSILKAFGRLINIKTPLVEPTVKNINRSLTRNELMLQMIFNEEYGGDSQRFISDALCEELPDLPSEHVSLTEAECAGLRDWLAEPLEEINRLMPDGQQFASPTAQVFRPARALDAQTVTLSSKQVRAIAKRLRAMTPSG